MSKADFQNAVCGRVSVFINCSGSDFFLDVKSYATFGDMVTSRPVDANNNFTDPGAFAFGSASDIVVVRAYYQWPTSNIFGALSAGWLGSVAWLWVAEMQLHLLRHGVPSPEYGFRTLRGGLPPARTGNFRCSRARV